MQQATNNLNDLIDNGSFDASRFSGEQLAAIKAGNAKIPGYTWHHNAQGGPNNKSEIHSAVQHIGQGALSQGS